MVRFVKGDVVVVPFPFSDLSAAKRRPAVVIATAGGADILLAQVTSRSLRYPHAVPLARSDFVHGGLTVESHVRPDQLFTADRDLILYRVGHLQRETIQVVVDRIKTIVDGD